MIIKGSRAPTSKSKIPSQGGSGASTQPVAMNSFGFNQMAQPRHHYQGVLGSQLGAGNRDGKTAAGLQPSSAQGKPAMSSIFDQEQANVPSMHPQPVTDKAHSALDGHAHSQAQKPGSHAAASLSAALAREASP